jgi:hypothetical protein
MFEEEVEVWLALREARAKMEPGDKVIIDAGYANPSEVTIVTIFPKRLFAVVQAKDGYEWQTMLTRLTPIDWKAPEK